MLTGMLQNISSSTLNYHVSGITVMGAIVMPPKYPSDAEQFELVNYLIGCSKIE